PAITEEVCTMESDDSQKLKVQEYVEGIHREKDLQKISELLAPDFVEHTGKPEHNAEQLMKNLGEMYKNLADPHTTIEEAISQGETVLYRWVLTGTYQGPNRVGRATGERESHSGVTILHITDGKVREMWNYVHVPPAKDAKLN